MNDPKDRRVLLVEAMQEFPDRIDELYGLYLDTTQGFKANVDTLNKMQEASAHLVSDQAALDQLPFFVGRGDPNDPNNVLLHQTTQGQFKPRNPPDGSNHRLLSQYFIVLVYHLWENEGTAEVREEREYSVEEVEPAAHDALVGYLKLHGPWRGRRKPGYIPV